MSMNIKKAVWLDCFCDSRKEKNSDIAHIAVSYYQNTSHSNKEKTPVRIRFAADTILVNKAGMKKGDRVKVVIDGLDPCLAFMFKHPDGFKLTDASGNHTCSRLCALFPGTEKAKDAFFSTSKTTRYKSPCEVTEIDGVVGLRFIVGKDAIQEKQEQPIPKGHVDLF